MSDLAHFQFEVGTWGNKTFGAATQVSIVKHLAREVKELAESQEPEEAADCLLLLLHHAHRGGYDLLNVARNKMLVNHERIWKAPDAEGVCEHEEVTS